MGLFARAGWADDNVEPWDFTVSRLENPKTSTIAIPRLQRTRALEGEVTPSQVRTNSHSTCRCRARLLCQAIVEARHWKKVNGHADGKC